MAKRNVEKLQGTTANKPAPIAEPLIAAPPRGMTRLRKLPDVEEQFQSAKTTIYKRVKNGTLPPPMHLGEKSSAWVGTELDAVLAAQVAGRSDGQIRELVKLLVAARGQLAAAAATSAGVHVGNDEQEVEAGVDGRQPAA